MTPGLRRLAGRSGRDELLGVFAPEALLAVLHDGPAPLAPGAAQAAEASALRIAIRGNVAHLADALEALGHDCSPAPAQQTADVALAASWRDVPEVLRIEGVRARARLALDHEADLLAPASAEHLWAEWAVAQPVHPISFEPGVDHAVFRALPTHRRHDLVLADVATPAAPLAILALTELHARRPELHFALSGAERELDTPFPHLHVGAPPDPATLAHAYASATVGLALSLAGPPPAVAEMLACGLPVIGLGIGANGAPITVSDPDPLALCGAIERLVDDLALRADSSRAGAEWVARRTWQRAAEQVEHGLREALRAAAM